MSWTVIKKPKSSLTWFSENSYTFKNSVTGKTITISNTDGLKMGSGSGTIDQVAKMFTYFLNNGEIPKKEQVTSNFEKTPFTGKQYNAIVKDLKTYEEKFITEMSYTEQMKLGLFSSNLERQAEIQAGAKRELGTNIEQYKKDAKSVLGDKATEEDIKNYIEDRAKKDYGEDYTTFFGENEDTTDINSFINYGEQIASENKVEELSPYLSYMESLRKEHQEQELGLLNTQADIAMQNADIASQQVMRQQADFKNQLIEQIKTDRLGKMRQGISPMQIANEELQFMVGNMQQSQSMLAQANQQRLGAMQQKQLNPYQAYINSQQAVTGGQGYTNLLAGLDATRASSLTDQMNILMQRYNMKPEQAALYASGGAAQKYVNDNPPKKG